MFRKFKFLILLTAALSFFLTRIIFPQEKILYTYVDYGSNEARAAILNTASNERLDLGFNRTYLPAWIGNNILFNGQNYIWSCNSDGSGLTKVGEGYRASVSQKENLFAFYSKNGISIFDSSLNFVKEIEVEAWTDVSVTWLKNDSAVSFYDLQKQICYLYFIFEDSIAQFGGYVYHPIQKGSQILFNRLEEKIYSVFLMKEHESPKNAKRISTGFDNSVVPIFSPNGKNIAYLKILPDSLQFIQSDMLRCELILYDIEKSETKIVAADAAFTDQAFPQFTFNKNSDVIFYTAVNENGLGVLKKIDLKSNATERLTLNPALDERFPVCK